ncbi:N-acetylmuramoyl-L-alanine amidase [Mycobacteroides abscessus]|uniref:N-acetylmuramoyl-L-alanine amidase n=1 Tax=Mycobacteroides abscessus TaxID=36809 RepID=UPI000C256920
MAITVKKNLVPANKYGTKCPHSMNAEYITVHNTANDASAENEISYMVRNNNQVSYHFAVDDKEVIQGVPLDRNAWHCGDGGTGTGNRKSIGVEICYSKSGGDRYKKAEALAIKFIAQLLKDRGWGIDKVKKHQDWSGKKCPHRILSEGRWNSFKEAIESELKYLNGSVSVASKTYTIQSGDTFWGIEEKLKIKHGTLEKLNPSVNPKGLKVGQVINISEVAAPAQKPAGGTFLVKVKAAELWYYSKPDWNAKKATVKRGDVFTVVETLTVSGSKMYKLKSGTYITANPQYVEVIK